MQQQTIIEIEFQQQDVIKGVQLAAEFEVRVEIKGKHPDGLVTLQFAGQRDNLESLVERVKPGDEFEAYLTV